MGCFDNASPDDDKPIDLSKTSGAGGAGGVGDWRNTYGSLFRARGFLDTSLQARAELPDPLWPRRMLGKPSVPFALRGALVGK
jgi:hypothetical protein